MERLATWKLSIYSKNWINISSLNLGGGGEWNKHVHYKLYHVKLHTIHDIVQVPMGVYMTMYNYALHKYRYRTSKISHHSQ